MKRIFLAIETYELEDFKTHKDGMKDYVKLVLLISRTIKNDSYIEADKIEKISNPFIMVDVSKNSRAYVFISYNKYYAISYPINIKIVDNTAKLYSSEKSIEINNQLISECLGIVNSLTDKGNFIDVWMDNDGHYSQSSIDILELIFHTEPSYLRYDYDKMSAKGREEKHPEHHLDVNLSRKGKYKLGLYEHLTCVDFINLVSEDADCFFLSKYNKLKYYANNSVKGERKYK